MPDAPEKAQQPEPLPQPIDVPMFYGSQVSLNVAGNEFVLIFSRGRPVRGQVGGEDVMLAEAQVAVSLAPETAKDLSVILSRTVKNWEKDVGRITSPFLKKEAEEAEKAKKAATAH